MNIYNNTEKISSVIILAAGLSGRIGMPKLFLKWHNNKTFIEKIISEYLCCNISEIVVVVNKEGLNRIKKDFAYIENSATIVLNLEPEKGRFSSIIRGLAVINLNSCFIHNVDNPFVNKTLVSEMNSLIKPDSFVVPVYKGKGGHPVLLGKDIVKYILSQTHEDRALNDVLKNFNRIEYKTRDSNILVNINTMDDYERLITTND